MQFGGIRIAKIFGIEIWLDYSWLVIFFLVFITLTLGLVPMQFPGLSKPVSLATGAVATLLFFVSIIAHELSHSLYAKSQGLKIKRITLFIFGGASELVDEPKSPKQEFLIAVVGPLTSLGLGLFFILMRLAGIAIGFTPLTALGTILAVINISLAIFNLLPGFPLDGGRIFRALVWKRTGSLARATRYASGGGRFLGGVLVLLGIAEILFTRSPGGLWLILIGLFLYQAAGLSYLRTMSLVVLKDLRVSDLMKRDFIAVARSTSVRELLEKYVLRYKDTAMVVEQDENHAAGVLDVDRLPEQALDKSVGRFVPPKSSTLNPKEPVTKALDMMLSAGMQKLPVADKGKLVGVLAVSDIQMYVISKSKLSA